MMQDSGRPSLSGNESGVTPRMSPKRKASLAAGVAAVAALSFTAGGFVFAQQDGPSAAGQIFHSDAQPAGVNGIEAIPIAAEVPNGETPRLLEQGAPFSFANLVEHVSPAVVTILTEREEQVSAQVPENIPEPFREFFRQFGEGQNGEAPQPRHARAMGSGFFIEADGYLVTNNHVVEDATSIKVQLPDGREFDAEIIGSDAPTDVALLKVDGVTDMPTVAFGDDRHLRVGDWVVAVGNPFGLGGTVTAGIVSSIERDIGMGPYTDYIQIDAPINQGNSGGPTFDLSGRVIGMNSAIFSPSGGSVGIGFAIPSTTVQQVVAQLKESGSVARGWLGVQIQNLTPDMAASLGVPDAKGAIVANVVENSPAERAGFQQGDVVTSVNGEDIDDQRDLTRRVGNLAAGDTATFVILRGGQQQTLTANIERRDEEQVASAATVPGNGSVAPSATESLGLSLMPLNQLARQQFNIDESIDGVLIGAVDANSEAAEKGFQPGMVIVAIGNNAVQTAEDIATGIAAAREAGRDSVLLLVADEQGQRFVTLNIDQN